MKWKFLTISAVVALQGGLLAWNEWMQWKDVESVRASSDGTNVICHISCASAWPPIASMILAFLVFFYCLSQFFQLNAAVPIQRKRLKILTRPK